MYINTERADTSWFYFLKISQFCESGKLTYYSTTTMEENASNAI